MADGFSLSHRNVTLGIELTTRPDRGKGRNTEILTFRGDHVCRTEAYFGWEVQ